MTAQRLPSRSIPRPRRILAEWSGSFAARTGREHARAAVKRNGFCFSYRRGSCAFTISTVFLPVLWADFSWTVVRLRTFAVGSYPIVCSWRARGRPRTGRYWLRSTRRSQSPKPAQPLFPCPTMTHLEPQSVVRSPCRRTNAFHRALRQVAVHPSRYIDAIAPCFPASDRRENTVLRRSTLPRRKKGPQP